MPFFGWGLANDDPIAINRNDPSSAMDQIIQQGKMFGRGRWILVFLNLPYRAQACWKYRLGGARLATATDCHSSYCIMQADFGPNAANKTGTIQVVIGPLIKTKIGRQKMC